MSADAPRDAISELERRIAEQDKVIADLNDMVVAQWRKIDSLERRVAELREEFDEAGGMQPGGPEKPPPHY
jgi:SlyX protein